MKNTEEIAICQGCQMAIEFEDFEWGTSQYSLTAWLDDLHYRNEGYVCTVNILGEEIIDAYECGICFDYLPKVSTSAEIVYTEM